MNLNLPKMFTQLLLLLRSNILISEKYHRSLSNQQCQLVFLLIRQILQLKTDNLRSDMRSQMNDFLCSGKQYVDLSTRAPASTCSRSTFRISKASSRNNG